MSHIKILIATIGAGMLTAAAPPVLTGDWAGMQVRLSLTKDGGRLEYDCGAGTISGAVRLDARQRFKAKGTDEIFRAGPTLEGAKPSRRTAWYEGSVVGDTMTLVIRISGESKPRTLSLVRGRRVKLIRCLA